MDLDKQMKLAVKQFWKKRASQGTDQVNRGKPYQGNRGTVTGGGHLNGFINLIRTALIESGCDESWIITGPKMEVPGFFRPTKKWDLLVIKDKKLLAAVETKSHVGSFGNNANNRTEEALGNATDLWTAYREGKFQRLPRPWLGWLMLLERSEKSIRAVRAKEPHFQVFPEYKSASYQRRYELLCERLVQEKLYDAACFITSESAKGRRTGAHEEPNEQLTLRRLLASLTAHVSQNL